MILLLFPPKSFLTQMHFSAYIHLLKFLELIKSAMINNVSCVCFKTSPLHAAGTGVSTHKILGENVYQLEIG